MSNTDICLSLDEYIKKKQINDSLSLMDYRKKVRQIDKDLVDAELDKIAHKNEKRRKSGLSKFDRYNDTESEDSEDEDDFNRNMSSISEDVTMMDLDETETETVQEENPSITFAKEIQQMEHPECCQIKNKFTTIESAKGIKIKSQQWRIQNEQKSTCENKVHNGRVKKNYKQRKTPKAGIFIEKGSFTYKFADTASNDSDENSESIVGIVRNRPVTKVINHWRRPVHFNSQNQSPICINMNWNDFFKGMSECVEKFPKVSTPQTKKIDINSCDESQLKIAAAEVYEYLLAKRAGKSPEMSAALYPKLANDDIIGAKVGDGIEDLNFTPKSTNLPMNLRFA